MRAFLEGCARRAKAFLIGGLVVGAASGLVWPGASEALAVTIRPMVVTLLFLAVLRLGPEGVRAGLSGVGGAVAATLALQMALPLGAAAGFLALGFGGAMALGIVLTLAASPITGTPNLTVMAGGDPAVALRALVLGTALLPVTVVPVFLLLPELGDLREVAGLVLRLLGLIALAGGLALALRGSGAVKARHLPALDGISAILLGAMVVPLMGAVGPALLTLHGWGLLALAGALNFGQQVLAGLVARRRGGDPVAAGVTAGNRNLSLFLGILPAGLLLELLPYVGLYQIPMYLTPLIMPPLYRRLMSSPIASRK